MCSVINLLDDIGTEFLNRQGTNVSCKLPDDAIAESVVIEVENVLNDVISVRILDESQSIVSDLIDELLALHFRCMVDAPLKDTTSMSVSSDFNTVGCNGVVDELEKSQTR